MQSDATIQRHTAGMDGERRGSRREEIVHIPSSSLTDSPIVTEVSWLEYCKTRILVSSIPKLRDVVSVGGQTKQGAGVDTMFRDGMRR